jgi:hypothetical protein
VQELLARVERAVSRPTRTSAGRGAGLRWESPTATRGQRIWTWIALVTAFVAVAALIVALIALLTARPKPGRTALPERAAVPAGAATPAPSAGTLWLVTTRDQKQFEGEFVTLAAGPGNETSWVFHLPDGTYEWVPTSNIRLMTQKGAEAP